MTSKCLIKRKLPEAPKTATKAVRDDRFEGYGKMIYERQIPTTAMELMIPPTRSNSKAAEAEREIKTILDLAREGKTASQIAEESGYNRTRVVQVVRRFAEYGAKLAPESKKRKKSTYRKKSTSNRWTEEKTRQLIELHRQNLPYSEIGRQIGVTKNAVTSKVQRLIEEGVLETRYDQVTWSAEDTEKLFKLRAQGKTWGEISDIIGRKLTACHMAYRRELERRKK